ncbi:MAG: zinc ribbon domain-containing protein [SAR324 cluster bacterium]|nr:zinc ribbon domain-containing protein [SAR324 cluster bacterium]
MPLFEYSCKSCSHNFTELRKIAEKDDDIKCPSCANSKATRTISTFSFGGAKAASNDAGCAKMGGCPNASKACTAGG